MALFARLHKKCTRGIGLADAIVLLLAPLIFIGTLDTLQELELGRRFLWRVANSLAGNEATLG